MTDELRRLASAWDDPKVLDPSAGLSSPRAVSVTVNRTTLTDGLVQGYASPAPDGTRRVASFYARGMVPSMGPTWQTGEQVATVLRHPTLGIVVLRGVVVYAPRGASRRIVVELAPGVQADRLARLLWPELSLPDQVRRSAPPTGDYF